MDNSKRVVWIKPMAATLLGWCAMGSASAQDGEKPRLPPLLQKMQGNWAVSQKMWPGSSQAAVDLPAAKAQRSLIQGSFLEEVMEPAQAGSAEPFHRVAYFEFNSATHKFEYFSIDSRMPQMMNERSSFLEPAAPGDINLDGSLFIASSWGKEHNVPFQYRLVVGDVKNNRQTVQLFLRREAGQDRREFLAFEYKYVRAE